MTTKERSQKKLEDIIKKGGSKDSLELNGNISTYIFSLYANNTF